MTGSEAEGSLTPPEVRSVDAADAVTLVYRVWHADVSRGCVRIVHGLGEHGQRYAPLAEALLERGVTTVAADLRGHGVSGGRRGHVDRFDAYLADFERVTDAALLGGPQILFGHSLGGLIAIRAVQTRRVPAALQGLVLSAPALQLAPPRPRGRDAGAAILSKLAPTLNLPNGIDPADLSHDPAAVAAYRADPLVHDRITPRLFREMRSAMRQAARDPESVEIPTLLLAPGEDRITDVPTAISVVKRFRGGVEVRWYPGYFHEPLNERRGSVVLNDLVEWVEEKLG